MDLPTYVKSADQENYNEELSQTLIQNLSDNGWIPPHLTNAQLTTSPFAAPDGTITTIANYMPNGSLWFVTDHVPPVYVGKIGNALVQFSTTAYITPIKRKKKEKI